MLLVSTYRGTVSILSSSLTDSHLIESNYFNIYDDHIHGSRHTMQALLDTRALADYIEAEVPPRGMSILPSQSSSGDFQPRIRTTCMAHHRLAGTAAMGKMVDPDLGVYRVHNPRVQDASILSIGINGYR